MRDNSYEQEILKIRRRELAEIKNREKLEGYILNGIPARHNRGGKKYNDLLIFRNPARVFNRKTYEATADLTGMWVIKADYFSRVRSGRFHLSGTDSYLYGVFHTKMSFPLTLIQPESFEEKILELFHPVEVEIPRSPLFNWRYFVLSNDEVRLKRDFPPALAKLIARYAEVHLELNGKTCAFRVSLKPVSKREVERFRKFALQIRQILA